MKYIREQKDPKAPKPAAWHSQSAFIEFRVLKISTRNAYAVPGTWYVEGLRPAAVNVTLAWFDTQEEAEEALADLMDCLTDPKAEDLVCPWPLEYVSSAGEAK